VVRVRNTLEIGRMWVTENLIQGEDFSSGERRELTFDAHGNLPEFEKNR